MGIRTIGSDRPVLSMGEILIDFIVADGAPALNSAASFHARAGGALANAAVALARLGVSSAFCGVVGHDPFGSRLRQELTAEHVDASRLRESKQAATTLAYAWKDARGDGHFWLLRGADTLLDLQDVKTAGIEHMAALVIGSVSLSAEPSRQAIESAVSLAKEAGVPIVFDVNWRPTLWSDLAAAGPVCEKVARQSTIVKLSLDDARGLFGPHTTAEHAIHYLNGLGPGAVVLTDGERGCWFSTENASIDTFVPAFAVDAIEPTGAGDAFSAALIARLIASEWSPVTVEDIVYAAAAGALATTQRGAWDGLPSRDQLDTFLESRRE